MEQVEEVRAAIAELERRLRALERDLGDLRFHVEDLIKHST